MFFNSHLGRKFIGIILILLVFLSIMTVGCFSKKMSNTAIVPSMTLDDNNAISAYWDELYASTINKLRLLPEEERWIASETAFYKKWNVENIKSLADVSIENLRLNTLSSNQLSGSISTSSTSINATQSYAYNIHFVANNTSEKGLKLSWRDIYRSRREKISLLNYDNKNISLNTLHTILDLLHFRVFYSSSDRLNLSNSSEAKILEDYISKFLSNNSKLPALDQILDLLKSYEFIISDKSEKQKMKVKEITFTKIVDYDEICKKLEEFPLIGIIPLYKDFLLYKGGVYKPLNTELIGYTTFIIVEIDKKQKTLYGKLNWGTDWGEQGYFKVKYDYIPQIAWAISINDLNFKSLLENAVQDSISSNPSNFDINNSFSDLILLENCPLVEFGPIIKCTSSNSLEIVWVNRPNKPEYEVEITDSKSTYRYRPNLKRTTNNFPIELSVVSIPDLRPSVDYKWRLLYKSQEGNVSQSPDYNLVIPSLLATAQSNIPLVFNISVSNITSQSARISWQTDIDSYGRVVYQPQNATQTYVKHDWKLSKLHSVNLTGLTGETIYYFYIQAWNNNLATFSSDPEIFQTSDITPPIVSNVSAVEITSNEATIVWVTNEPTIGQVEYGLSPGYGWHTPFGNEFKKTHRVRIKDLKPNSTYFFRIRAKDHAGNETETSSYTFTTFSDLDMKPNKILVASATSIATNSAVIVWQTLKNSTSLVEYGTSLALGLQSNLDPNLKTIHMVQISDLIPDTTYFYRVRSKDQQGFEAISDTLTFRTRKNLIILPLVIENATATLITDTSATIVWTTNIPAKSYVEYGTTQAYGLISRKTTDLRYSHLIKITGLIPDREYFYRVISEDEYGNIASLSLPPFRTVDTIPPLIQNITISNITGNSANITFFTNEPSLSKIEYGINNYSSQIISSFTIATTTHNFVLTSLVPATTYKFRIWAWDKANNQSVSSDQYIKTLDTILPSIWNVRAEEVTNNSASILWNTDKQCTSLVIFGPTSNNYTSTSTFDPTFKQNHSVRINFDPTVSYQWFYRVISKDRLGNESTSDEYVFRLPLIITNLRVSGITDSSAVISWNTTTSATSIVEYGTNLDLEFQEPQFVDPLQLSSSHTITLVNLKSGTTYYFRVKSRDLSGRTVTSNVQNFTTLTTSQPPLIANIVVYNITNNSAIVSWSTNPPTTGYVEFGLDPYKFTNRIVSSGGLKTSHTVNLANLISGRSYYFQIFATDVQGRVASSPVQTFATTGIKYPLISNIRVFDINDRSVRVEWNSDDECYSELRYGTTNTLEFRAISAYVATTSHSVILTNLQPSTTYYYRVICRNAYTNLESTSNLASFTTLDNTAPIIYDVQVANIGSTTVTIQWKTDELATRQVRYWHSSSTMYETPVNPLLNKVHQVMLTGLQPATTYNFIVVSADKYGNIAFSATDTFSTLDLSPPIVSNISIEANNGLVATISFETNKPSLAWVDYGTTTSFGNTRPLSPSQYITSHSILLENLQQGLTYWYRIRAIDKFGNSATTRSFAFTNLDLIPPIISSVRAINITENSVTISFKTDERSKATVEYGTTPILGNIFSRDIYATDHSINISLLNSNTKYYYKVKAQDIHGNTSEAGIFSFETLDRTPPRFVTIPSATTILEESTVISWITNEPSISRVEFGQNTNFTRFIENNSYISTHVVVLDNLKPLTTYYYRVKITDRAGNENTSEIYSFTTPAILLIQNIQISFLTATQATLLWDTTVPAYCEISHGRTIPLPFSNIPEDNIPGVGSPFTGSHTVTINLEGPFVPSTYYYFIINATSVNGVRKNSGLRYFLTP